MESNPSKNNSRKAGSFSVKRARKMAKIRENYEVEGFKARVVILYHVTSPESAKSIVNSKKMLRGSQGMFGGGIYFAETIEIANRKAQYSGATITAEVVLGFSLICRNANYEMNYQKLIP